MNETHETPSQCEYWAFISYRHLDNRQPGRLWATWLHRQLEGYEIPSKFRGQANGRGDVIPDRIYPVFRDEADLPADADLQASIRHALDRSKSLIVICSPQAAQSRYVSEEIAYFKKIGKGDRIIAVIVDGEPNVSWDAKKREAGFAAERECFPFSLMHPVDKDGRIDAGVWEEPVAADFRLQDGRQGWVSARDYRKSRERDVEHMPDVIAIQAATQEQILTAGLQKIVAGVLGIPNRDYVAEEAAYRVEKDRRRVRVLTAWLTVVFVFAVCAMGAAVFGWIKEKEAVQQRNEAERQKTEAQRQAFIAKQSIDSLTGMFDSLDPAEVKQREITVREVMDRYSTQLDWCKQEPQVEMPIRQCLGNVYFNLGRIEDSLKHNRRALQLAMMLNGNTPHDDTARILKDEGLALFEMGRVKDALDKFETSLSILRRLHVGDHQAIGLAISGEVGCLAKLGRLPEALEKSKEAVKMLQRLSGGDNPNVAVAYNNVALILQELGRYAEALTSYEVALSMYRRIYKGNDHPNVAKAINNIATCLGLQSQDPARLTKMLPLREEALAMWQRIYKGNHPSVAVGFYNLADTLGPMGRNEEALSANEKSLSMFKRLFKGDHPSIADTICQQASILISRGHSCPK